MPDNVVAQTNTDSATTTNTTDTNLLSTTPEIKDAPVTGDPTKGTDSKADETKKDSKTVEYTDFKMPEGFKADTEVVTSFKSIAKEFGLSQDQAQKLVDFQANLTSTHAKATDTQWKEIQDGWVKDAKADKDIGGEKFNENLAIAKKALEKFGTPALRDAINLTGMGNHPEFVRLLVRVGQHFKEDKVMTDGNNPQKVTDVAKLLFPNQN